MDLCHARVVLGLVDAWLLHNKHFILNAPSLFHIPFLFCATSTILVAFFVLPSFHKHSPTPGLPPFRLLLPLVAMAPSHLSSSLICMPQFALPSSFDALEYRLQGTNAKELDLSTRLDNSNANMLQ